MNTTIKIAGLAIGLEYNYEYTLEYVKEFLTDEPPVFTVGATAEDIKFEHEYSGITIPDKYAENIVLYRKIAEKLPEYDALVFHGAVLEYDGVAYAVTAHSGVGKTTHTRLWLKEFEGKAKILNGDKPILRIIDGEIYAASTPWRGKEGYGYNGMRKLGGIGFLARGIENKSRTVTPDDAVMKFMNQIYVSKVDAPSLIRSMRVCNKLLSGVPLYEFECNMNPDAAHVTRDAFISGILTD